MPELVTLDFNNEIDIIKMRCFISLFNVIASLLPMPLAKDVININKEDDFFVLNP